MAPSRDRFVLGALLGAGTFGEVYLARQRSPNGIEQDVAVKLLNPGLDERSQAVSRMRDEGRLLAGLNHPAILQVMDFCNLDGRIGLVTEYLPGADLDECIHGDDPIPARAAVLVVGQVADALHAAFESRTVAGARLGLVHRDIKPANIRVTHHGSVKLLDFGIAKSSDAGRETATQQKVAFGTPAYMAPEVLSYEVLEALPSRDVFALGCTLFEALTVERFFHGLDHQAIGRLCNKEERFREWRAQRLAKLAGQHAELVELVGRMTAYAHLERPSAREVAETCLALADRMQGASLWSWARAHAWPTSAAHQSGPWTGRTLFDTSVHERATGPEVDTGQIASVLATGDGHYRVPGAPPTLAPAQPSAASPRAAKPSTPSTPSTPPAPVAPTTVIVQQGAAVAGFQIAAIVAMGVAGMLVVVLAGLILLPIVLSDGKAPNPLARAARRAAGGGGEAADTARPVEAGSAGTTRFAFGAAPDQAEGRAASVQLVSDGDIVVVRTGKRPQGVPPMGVVRLSPGPIEVRASFGGGYEPQFSTVLAAGQQLRVSCDAQLRRCARD